MNKDIAVQAPFVKLVMDMSTGHIAECACKHLSEPGDILIVDEHEYGWWIRVPCDDLDDEDFRGPFTDRFGYEGQSILDILRFARKWECDLIHLHAEGYDFDELHKYDW